MISTDCFFVYKCDNMKHMGNCKTYKCKGGAEMDFRLINNQELFEAGFAELLRERGYSCKGGIKVSMELSTEKTVSVSFDGANAVISGPEKNTLFRGLMNLVLHLEKYGAGTGYSENEQVHYEKNGVMLDCSRNCVMSIPAVKAWMRMQASVGMNTVMLYTEDTYEVPEYPYFGAFRGRYTKEEIQELDQYAQIFGIELIPCIQTLGHLHQPLRWEPMRELRDTSDILMVGNEKVYTFIRACLKQISECFSTKRVHLGMDEAWTLGLGQYIIQNGFTSKEQLMKEHLDRVMEICREFELEPMIWSDMYMRVHSENEEYYNVPVDEDMTSKEMPPEGMGLVYWDYYHTNPEFYENYIHLHRQLTDNVWFAGGVWSWNGIVPNLKTGYTVTKAAMEGCRRAGIDKIVVTAWGDDATESPQYSILGPVLMAAESGYGAFPQEKEIKEKFEFLTGCSFEAYQLLGEFNTFGKEIDDKTLYSNASKNLLYQDVLCGIYDGQMEGIPMGSYYGKLADQMACLIKNGCNDFQNSTTGFFGAEMKQVLHYYQLLARTLSVKADMGLRIRSAYETGSREELRKIAQRDLQELMQNVEKLRCQRKHVWMKEGRIFGWEVLDIRFRALYGRIDSAAERLMDYVNGSLDCLPEVEEPRLPLSLKFSGERRLFAAHNSWVDTVSASRVAWGWLPQ